MQGSFEVVVSPAASQGVDGSQRPHLAYHRLALTKAIDGFAASLSEMSLRSFVARCIVVRAGLHRGD